MLSSRLRARPLDLSKPLEIVRENDEILEDAIAYRDVPNIAPQMIAEEEQEKHLQENLEKGTLIPIPGVVIVPDYDIHVSEEFIRPEEYIVVSDRRQVVDYDADESDEEFIKQVEEDLGCQFYVYQFEQLIDIFEKKEELSNNDDFTSEEATRVVSFMDDQLEKFVSYVFPYWKKKRQELGRSLIVKLPNPAERKAKTKSERLRSRKKKPPEKKLPKKGIFKPQHNTQFDSTEIEGMEEIRRELVLVRKILEIIKKREEIKLKEAKVYLKRFELLSAAVEREKSQKNRKLFTPCDNIIYPLESSRKRKRNGNKARIEYGEYSTDVESPDIDGEIYENFRREKYSGDYDNQNYVDSESEWQQSSTSPVQMERWTSEETIFDLEPVTPKKEQPPLSDKIPPIFGKPSPPSFPFTLLSTESATAEIIPLSSIPLLSDRQPIYIGRRRYGRGGRLWWDRIRIGDVNRLENCVVENMISKSNVNLNEESKKMVDNSNTIPGENITDVHKHNCVSRESTRISQKKWKLCNSSLYNWKKHQRQQLDNMPRSFGNFYTVNTKIGNPDNIMLIQENKPVVNFLQSEQWNSEILSLHTQSKTENFYKNGFHSL